MTDLSPDASPDLSPDLSPGWQPEPDTGALELALGHQFSDSGLLDAALRHASYAHEQVDASSNQRLEFLGDAVVGLVVGRLLFDAHPDWEEGDLTRGLHSLVDRSALADLGRQLDIGRYLWLGKTEVQSQGHTKSSVLADATEAVLAAMYLDAGLEPVFALAQRVFAKALAVDAPRVKRDPKTDLQERVMSRFGEFPLYELVRDSELDGDPERFAVSVKVEGKPWGEGVGRNKRAAERAAAERALCDRASELETEHPSG